MGNAKIAPHEAIEVREFLNLQVIDIKKISSTISMVKDEELKSFMKDSTASKKTAVQELTSVLSVQI